jgi:N-acetylglucosamine-6-sulfatase
MSRRAALGGALAVVVLALAIVTYAVVSNGSGAPRTYVGAPNKPSIVFILTDDQRWDTMDAMPIVQRELAAKGVTFVNALVEDPLCCPSRATILTGQDTHTHGVWLNAGPIGGFQHFKDASTVATWLHAAGYRTAMVGKYLNQYKGTYVPPGWDRWVAISDRPSYFDYELNVDGHLKSFGSDPADLSTDVLAAQATSFIRNTRGALFVTFAPWAPHIPISLPPRDRNSFANLPAWNPPAYDEPDVSDKPAWVRALPRLSAKKKAEITDLRRKTLGSLQAVDRAVGQIVKALEDTGRLHDTLIVFTSDNGYAWGEHRWAEKVAPYEESIRVPLIVRYDPIVPKTRKDAHLVGNVDFAPTFASVAGVPAPGSEGMDLMALLRSSTAPWRDRFLVESMTLIGVPSYCEVRTERYAYVVYSTSETELYDLRADAAELTNRAGDPAMRGTVSSLRRSLQEMCSPPPPDFPKGLP